MSTKTKTKGQGKAPTADVLFGGLDDVAQESGVQEIPLDDIQPGDNVRKTFDQSGLEELAASIKEHGVIQPVIVVPHPNGRGYQLVAGERRWRASQLAGLQTIPAVVRDMTPEQVLQVMIVENLQREDVLPIEEAQGFRRLLDLATWTQTQLAERIGKSQAHVANRLRLLKLPAEVQKNVAAGKLPVSHALLLLRLEDSPKFMGRTAHHLMQKDYTAAEVPAAIDHFIATSAKPLDDNQPWLGTPLFDKRECKGCPHAVKAVPRGYNQAPHPYCLNEACWDKKQKAAQVEQGRVRAERAHAAAAQAPGDSQGGEGVAPTSTVPGDMIQGQREQVVESRLQDILKKIGDGAAPLPDAADHLPLALELREAAIKQMNDRPRARWGDAGHDRECFLPIETLLAHFKERLAIGATSMPLQMGALRIIIPEQGVDFHGAYGIGTEEENITWTNLAEMGVTISNAAGSVTDSAVSSSDWVYYRAEIRSLTQGTCYLEQTVVLKGTDRTFVLVGSASVTAQRAIKIKWLKLLNQLPGFPGLEDPAGVGDVDDEGEGGVAQEEAQEGAA